MSMELYYQPISFTNNNANFGTKIVTIKITDNAAPKDHNKDTLATV